MNIVERLQDIGEFVFCSLCMLIGFMLVFSFISAIVLGYRDIIVGILNSL